MIILILMKIILNDINCNINNVCNIRNILLIMCVLLIM